MRKPINNLAAILCVVLLCSAIVLDSTTRVAAEKSGLDGTYTLDEANSDKIDVVIDKAVAQFNFLERHFAREHLKKLNPAYQRVTIGTSQNDVSVAVENQPAVRAPASGTPITWTDPDGGKVNLSMRLVGNHLVQNFKSADGGRVNDYSLSSDGRTLMMQVTETSPRLSQAIKYKQVYRRSS
jgi:hypothetical protein